MKTNIAIHLFLLALMANELLAQKDLDFNRDIQPILSNYCYACHGPDEEHRKGELRLDLRETALLNKDGVAAIVPGKPEASEMIARILHHDPEERMPPQKTKKTMQQREIELLKAWIAQGAEYKKHWAFIPPSKKDSAITPVNSPWRRNSIDDYILTNLREKGLNPSEEADKRTLIRRLSFDLRGLPPTQQEVNQFLKDHSKDAYENLVDRLLASPHYGERMATMWLDAARYGDTSIFYADGTRDMWAWRDLMVDFYNQNLPFDRFSTYQLAGDLLPNPTREQLVASGFNRNHGTSDEGGIDKEEYRIKNVMDRVNTTSSVWMGLTMGCAQCHDHKYDPITQVDYYRLFAFFNNHADPGKQSRRGNTYPVVYVPDPKNKTDIQNTQQKLDHYQAQKKELLLRDSEEVMNWIKTFSQTPKLNDDLKAVTHLDYQTITANSSSNLGLATLSDGPFGTSLNFTKNALYLYDDIGNFGQFERFSFSFWLNPDHLTNGTILSKDHRAKDERGYSIRLDQARLSVQLVNHNKNALIKVRTDKVIKKQTWQNVVVTYDGSMKAKGIRIYLNGERLKTDVVSDTLKMFDISIDQPFTVGATHNTMNKKVPVIWRYRGKLDELKIFDRCLTWPEILTLQNKETFEKLTQKNTLAKEYTAELKDHYQRRVSSESINIDRSITSYLKKLAEYSQPITSVMIMGDMSTPRKTYRLSRGQFNKPVGEPLTAGAPESFPQLSDDMPKNRLGLARWLFSKDHPLTARVAVNRYWQMIFGAGLVTTANDFGLQGTYPSHPKLLDHLAITFMESEWNIKHLLKTIVMSATYRQSSDINEQSMALDPENTLLSRAPRHRLQAEFIRDNALEISGLLNKEMGGPGVKPYQPKGVWTAISRYGDEYEQDHGQKLYRRSLYTYWKRSAPPPNMQIFDAPTREKCVLTRSSTNTPLQAFVTMNDPQFVEAARALAENVLTETKGETAQALDLAFNKATARPPLKNESRVLVKHYQQAHAYYSKNPEAASNWIKNGESKVNNEFPAGDLAAMMLCSNMILNLDEVITKE